MPRKRQTRRRDRRWVGVVFVVLLVSAGLVVYAVAREIQGSGDNCADGSANCDGGQEETGGAGGDEGGCSLCDEDENQTTPVIESEKDIVHDEIPTGDVLGVWVTSKNVVNGTLQIRVQVDQVISSGTCSIEIGNYSTSVAVVSEPQGASCEGFDVPVGSYSGNNFAITVKSGDKSGSVAGEING